MPTPTALMTGGTSGIGRATALVLHERGFNVVITGQNHDTITRARAELPGDIVIFAADSRSLTDTDCVVDEIRARFGGLTALFLNAGITGPRPPTPWMRRPTTSCSRSTPRVSSSPCKRPCRH